MSNERALPRMGINISAGTTSALAGTAVLSNANGFSFGMSLSESTASITASRGGGGLALSAGTTQISTGQMVLSNSNGLVFGVNGQTITGKPVGVSFWDNRQSDAFIGDIGQIYFYRPVWSRDIGATRIDFVVSLSTLIASQYTVSVGIYTINGTSASIVSSTSLAVTWTNTNSSAQTGSLWRSVPVSFALALGGAYMFAVGWSYATNDTGASVLGRAARTDFGRGQFTVITNYFNGPVIFNSLNSTISTMPSTIAASQFDVSNSDGSQAFAPYMRLVGTY